MLIDTRHVRLPLTLHHVARLENACHTRLSVREGTAWITLDGDPRDIVLGPGEDFVVDSNATVVIYPLHGAKPLALDIDTAHTKPRCAPRNAGWLARAWAQLLPARTALITAA